MEEESLAGDHLSISLVPECLIMINNINIINSINSFIMAPQPGLAWPDTRQDWRLITSLITDLWYSISSLSLAVYYNLFAREGFGAK